MLREAERPPSGHPLGFTFATLTADNVSLPDATFDAMFAYFMLYQVDDRPQAIRETARVLRPGGQLYTAKNGAQHIVEARLLAMNAGLMTPAEVDAGDAAEFGLENGADQLRAAFPLVELRRYEDRLVVRAPGNRGSRSACRGEGEIPKRRTSALFSDPPVTGRLIGSPYCRGL